MIRPGQPTYNVLNKTAEAFFAEGNYGNAAFVADENSWLKYAALALIAHPDACERLKDFSSIEEARFYQGVGHWIQGQDDEALELLSTVHFPHADRLAAEIRKTTIPVLIQSPWAVRNMVLYPARHDRKFRVFGIGPMDHARPVTLYTDISHYFDRTVPPLFFYSLMVEWQHLPTNLGNAPFLCFGRTSDYDLHVQAVIPLLNRFDALLAHDGSEMQNLQPLAKAPVFTFPKCFGLTSVLPALSESIDREFDLLFSGTVLNAYYPDKARLIQMILETKSLKVKFINRFLTDEQYFKNLGKSRVSVSYVRWAGGWSTRALESYVMGCYTLVQKGSIFTLFFGPEDGVGTYDFMAGDLSDRMLDAVKNWEHYSQKVLKGCRRARSEWTSIRSTSQSLRFMTYLATNPELQKRKDLGPEPMQKRMIMYQGWTYPSHRLQRESFVQNFERCYRALGGDPKTTDLIDLLRETIILTGAQRLNSVGVEVNPWRLREVLSLCEQGMDIFPRCLVLRLDYCKAVFHNGTPLDVEKGIQEILKVIEKPFTDWDVDPMEDVFPWDYVPEVFDYRSYFDRVCRIISKDETEQYPLHSLIYGCLYRYLAAYTGELDHFRKAVEHCPSYAPYSLALARRLLDEGQAGPVKEAVKIFERLAEGSILMTRSIAALRVIADAGFYTSPKLEELESRLPMLDLEGNERGLELECQLPLRPARVVAGKVPGV